MVKPGVSLRTKLPAKCRLISPYRETDSSRISDEMCENFQTLIISAVKIYQQCLQTASASRKLRPDDFVLGLRRWAPLGDFRPPKPLGYSLK